MTSFWGLKNAEAEIYRLTPEYRVGLVKYILIYFTGSTWRLTVVSTDPANDPKAIAREERWFHGHGE